MLKLAHEISSTAHYPGPLSRWRLAAVSCKRIAVCRGLARAKRNTDRRADLPVTQPFGDFGPARFACPYSSPPFGNVVARARAAADEAGVSERKQPADCGNRAKLREQSHRSKQ